MPSASAMIFWVAVSSAAGSAGAAEPEPEAEPALAGAAAAGQQGRRHGEGQRQCKKPLLHRVMSSSKIFFGVA